MGIGLAFLAIVLLIGTSDKNKNSQKTSEISPTIPQEKTTPISPPSTAETPKTEIKAEASPESSDEEFLKVVDVIDGDTIKVDIGGNIETLRLIGMDTPETVDPRKPVQCFAEEASNQAKKMLAGNQVKLEADETQGERDKYDRLLRYVFLEDGTFYNEYMIAEGFAHEYTYQSNPYKYQADFQKSEKNARENKKGFWGDACNGDTTQPANPSEINDGPQVKKSTNNICHEKGTTYYNKTKNFTPYDSIEACLESGARLPKR